MAEEGGKKRRRACRRCCGGGRRSRSRKRLCRRRRRLGRRRRGLRLGRLGLVQSRRRRLLLRSAAPRSSGWALPQRSASALCYFLLPLLRTRAPRARGARGRAAAGATEEVCWKSRRQRSRRPRRKRKKEKKRHRRRHVEGGKNTEFPASCVPVCCFQTVSERRGRVYAECEAANEGMESGRRRREEEEREREKEACEFPFGVLAKKVIFFPSFSVFSFFFQNKTSPFVAVAETRASLSVIAYSANEPHGRPRCTGRRPRRVRLPAAAAAAACDDAMMPLHHQQQNQRFAGAAPPAFAGGLLPQAGQGRPGRAFDRHDPAFYKTRMCTQVSWKVRFGRKKASFSARRFSSTSCNPSLARFFPAPSRSPHSPPPPLPHLNPQRSSRTAPAPTETAAPSPTAPRSSAGQGPRAPRPRGRRRSRRRPRRRRPRACRRPGSASGGARAAGATSVPGARSSTSCLLVGPSWVDLCVHCLVFYCRNTLGRQTNSQPLRFEISYKTKKTRLTLQTFEP